MFKIRYLILVGLLVAILAIGSVAHTSYVNNLLPAPHKSEACEIYHAFAHEGLEQGIQALIDAAPDGAQFDLFLDDLPGQTFKGDIQADAIANLMLGVSKKQFGWKAFEGMKVTEFAQVNMGFTFSGELAVQYGIESENGWTMVYSDGSIYSVGWRDEKFVSEHKDFC
jgi:hypothetical protein